MEKTPTAKASIERTKRTGWVLLRAAHGRALRPNLPRMKLYDFPFAPNPRRLRVYLAETGIEIPRVTVDLRAGEQRAAEFLAKNPHGSLPVLELDDGTLLSESEAIIEYLEELNPEPAMIGSTRSGRIRFE